MHGILSFPIANARRTIRREKMQNRKMVQPIVSQVTSSADDTFWLCRLADGADGAQGDRRLVLNSGSTPAHACSPARSPPALNHEGTNAVSPFSITEQTGLGNGTGQSTRCLRRPPPLDSGSLICPAASFFSVSAVFPLALLLAASPQPQGGCPVVHVPPGPFGLPGPINLDP